MTAPKCQGICPTCGTFGPPELFLGEAARRGAVKAALALPSPLCEQVLAYVGMWRPIQRGHSWDRVEAILTGLLTLIEAGSVTTEAGAHVQASEPDWLAGLNEMIQRRATLDLPMTSHGYLVRLVADAARRRTAKAEADRLSRGRGETPTGYSPAHRPQTDPDRRAAPDASAVHELTARVTSLQTLIAASPATAGPLRQQLTDTIAALRARGIHIELPGDPHAPQGHPSTD